MCLGGELPLLLLPEPALRCGGGCRLLRPGCGLPDPVVSNSPSPQDTKGASWAVCQGLPCQGLAQPAAPCRLLGLELEVLPGLRKAQHNQDCGHRLGCLTSIVLKTPEEAIMVLESLVGGEGGAEKAGEEQVGKTVSFQRHCQTPDQT